MSSLWNTYKSTVYAHCTQPGVARNSVHYWKNRLFAATVFLMIPMSLIALVPGVYMASKLSLYGLLFSDFISVIVILGVAFIPKISVFSRKLLLNGALYQSAIVLLHYLGSNGPGLLYLFAVTIFVLVSLDQFYGYLALALNTIVCIGFGLAIHYGLASHVLLGEYELDAWVGVSSNLIFLSGIAVFLIPKLFNGLQSAFENQSQLQDELESSVDELNAKNEELELFAYTVSHDLKEPLRMVRSFMELLEKKYKDKLDDKAQRYIHYAVDGAQRMRADIDDLLEYSRIGRTYNSVEETDLNILLESITKTLQTEIENKQAEFSISALPTLSVVPVAMKMLFQNLIGNALKYQQPGEPPRIEITARENDSTWQFWFSDNGIGIDPTYHEQIFAIFKRLHRREEYPGNGMGLAICQKVVEQHGGDIWVAPSEEQGTTFTFTIRKQYLRNTKDFND